jgi:aminoacrylate peracid reductase
MPSTSSRKEIVNPGKAPSVPYSRAVKAGGLIYLSGTLAQDDTGGVLSKGDVAAQTRRVLERMREVLTAAGSSCISPRRRISRR